MMASLEVGDKRFFLEYGLKVRKVRKTYRNGRYRVVLEKEKLEGLEIWGVYEYGEIATAALRLVDELYNKHNLGRDEVLKKLKDFYGLNEQDAKELLDFAEWYLFSG